MIKIKQELFSRKCCFRNKPLAECYLMEIKASPEKWINLPDLPIPIVGIKSFFRSFVRYNRSSIRI